jgi:hypothetical protein
MQCTDQLGNAMAFLLERFERSTRVCRGGQ